jgi:hypothetical protein
MGVSQESGSLEPLLQRWVWVNTEELETDAKELLERNATEEQPEDAAFTRLIDRLRDEVFLPKLTMTADELNGVDVYVLSLDLNDEDWDVITTIYQEEVGINGSSMLDTDEVRLKDVIKTAQLNILVDKRSYRMRKTNLLLKIDSSAYAASMADGSYGVLENLEPEIMDIAFSLGMDNFESITPIVAPAESTSFEKYMAEVMRLFSQMNLPEEALLQEGVVEEQGLN